MDRCQAMARGQTLPDRITGAALFADISGFSALTEALTQSLGPHRGAEELARQLDLVYEVLIAEVHRYGGSVISFAGDAITCWFDAAIGEPSLHAAACALAIQQAMQQFAALTLPGAPAAAPIGLAVKVAIASGPARRFIVGDPAIQLMDVLAGQTLARMAAAEQLAQRGEVIVDAPTATRLEQAAEIVGWRTDKASNARFAMLSRLDMTVEAAPWSPLTLTTLSTEQMRPWLLRPVYDRLRDGLGEFLLELRPAVALFLRFAGIDYDGDDAAGARLDAYIRWAQQTVAHYDGAMLQLTIGDKGSYLYAVFGAPLAHEDDARRAVSAALELSRLPANLDFIQPPQIGLSQGIFRTGAYGGTMRRTYGALGDEVNVAARLMQHAAPGEALASQRVQKAAGPTFIWHPLAPITVKGKSQPIPVAQLAGQRAQAASAIFHTATMVGRQTELAQLTQFVQPIYHGKFAGLAWVHGEAGMGKSRLVFELQQQLAARQPAVKWFTCPSEAILHQPLYPFKRFLQDYFNQRTDQITQENQAVFEDQLDALIAAVAPHPSLASALERTRAALGDLLGLHWEGTLYEQMDPRLRFENIIAGLTALVRAINLEQPLILHFEDAHWLDSESQQIIKSLTRNADDYPFALILTSRYRDDGGRYTVDVAAPQLVIDLAALTPAGVRQVAAHILGGDIADELADLLTDKTGGNPFFVEQLALDLRERGAIHLQDGVWRLERRELFELPPTINALLIARLDRLAAQVKAVVQTASVLGQEFEVQVLSQMLHDDPHSLHLKVAQAETQAIWSALSEIRYIFKHALLRDAAYDMQLQTRLRDLHALAGAAIEQVYADNLAPHYAELAFHFGKAQNTQQERRYSRLSGEASWRVCAFSQALVAFERALALTPQEDIAARTETLIWLGQVHDKLGNYAAAQECLQAGLDLARQSGNLKIAVQALDTQSWLAEVQGRKDQAGALAHEALDLARQSGDRATIANALMQAASFQPNDAETLRCLQDSLAIFRELGLVIKEAVCLLNMGNLAFKRREYDAADRYYQDSLTIFQKCTHRWGVANCLNNLGGVAFVRHDYDAARNYYREALGMAREMGDREVISLCLINLGQVSLRLGDPETAIRYFRQSLPEIQAIGATPYLLDVIAGMAELLARQGNHIQAAEWLGLALSRFPDRERDAFAETTLAILRAALPADELAAALERGKALDVDQVIAEIQT